MKITYIIFIVYITCFASHCTAEDEGKKITSSYAYSIEYNDSDDGNFGHRIEVKDGTAKVNVRSENSKKFNSAVASKPGKPYLPQKKPVIFTKPKEELAYVSAPEISTAAPVFKNTQQYSAPQLQLQPQKNPAVEAALKKYSQEQLSILLSQNKNPFLPLDPKDSINQFLTKYSTPQSSQLANSHQTQTTTGYLPQVQYQPQSYPQTPTVSSNPKSQYPTTYYTPSIPQQNSPVQYYQPQVQQSYQPASYLSQNTVPSHISSGPQTQSVPASQGPVQYVYVPQTASHPISASQSSVASHLQSASYGTSQTGAVQFAQQSYQPVTAKQQYVPNTSGYQSAQLSSYPSYSPESQLGQQPSYPSSISNGYASSVPSSIGQGSQHYLPTNSVQQSTYTNSLSSGYASPVSTLQANQQYLPSSSTYQTKPVQQSAYTSTLSSGFASPVSAVQGNQQYLPSNSAYQSTQAVHNIPNAISQGAQPSYQNVYGSSSSSQYPTSASSTYESSSNTALYKPAEGAQFSSPYGSTNNIATYKPVTEGASQFSQGNLDYNKYTQYVPASNQASPTVIYKSSEGAQPSSTTGQYYSGLPNTAGAANYAASTTGQDAAKSGIFGSNSGHNLFAGLQSSPNFGSLYSGATGITQGAAKYSVNPHSAEVTNYGGATTGQNAAKPGVSGSNSGHNLFAGLQSSPNFGSLYSGATGTTQGAAKYSVSPQSAEFNNYGGATTGQNAAKPGIFGSNSGHNLFAGLQSSPNFASLFSGALGSTAQVATKYSSNPSQISSSYGANTYPQIGNSATSTANYKPVVENSSPSTGAKLQYQSPNVNSILGSNSNFDISKFQPSVNLANFQSNYNAPTGHNFNLNQISNVQATDNKNGQYAIDIRQGSSPSGSSQVTVQTNYNLGAQNTQPVYSPAPANAASDNSNVRYVYVPSYAPSSPEATNHGK